MKRKDISGSVGLVIGLAFAYWLLFMPSHPTQPPKISREDLTLCTMAAVDEYPLDAGYSLVDQLITDQNRRGLLAVCETSPNLRALISANKEP